MKETTIRSTHLDDTAQAISRLRTEHDRKATPLQRIVDDLTGRAGSPAFAIVLTIVLDIAWPQDARDKAADAIAHSICSQRPQPEVCSQP